MTRNLKLTSRRGRLYAILRGRVFTSHLLGENSAEKTLTLENIIIAGSSSTDTAATTLIVANIGNIELTNGAVL